MYNKKKISVGRILMDTYHILLIDKLKVLKCSSSAKKYPGNRMLGWREFIKGKVF